jgi:hypothetical protein
MAIEMAMRSMETAETAMETDGDWLQGHFPVLARCQNREFCPPKFVGGGGGAAKLFLKNHRSL